MEGLEVDELMSNTCHTSTTMTGVFLFKQVIFLPLKLHTAIMLYCGDTYEDLEESVR